MYKDVTYNIPWGGGFIQSAPAKLDIESGYLLDVDTDKLTPKPKNTKLGEPGEEYIEWKGHRFEVATHDSGSLMTVIPPFIKLVMENEATNI